MRQSKRRARAPYALWEVVEIEGKRACGGWGGSNSSRRKNRPVVGGSKKETMMRKNSGACESYMTCMVKREE